MVTNTYNQTKPVYTSVILTSLLQVFQNLYELKWKHKYLYENRNLLYKLFVLQLNKSYLGRNYSQFLWMNDSFGQIISVCWIQPLLGTRSPSKWLKIFHQNFFLKRSLSRVIKVFPSLEEGWKAGDKEDRIGAGASIIARQRLKGNQKTNTKTKTTKKTKIMTMTECLDVPKIKALC